MASRHLSTKSHKVAGRHDVWWDEVNAGLFIYHQGKGGKVSEFLIPWRSLRDALARKDKPKDA